VIAAGCPASRLGAHALPPPDPRATLRAVTFGAGGTRHEPPAPVTDDPALLAGCLAGVIGGLVLLWRGFAGYLSAARVGDTSTSRIATLAAGEVRVMGIVEPAEVTLTSPLQGRECVWYHATVTSSRDGDDVRLDEERGIGFRVRDGSGSIRVFPRGARLDVPDRFDDRDSLFGEPPVGLATRPAGLGIAEPLDREAAIAALLTVRPAEPERLDSDALGSDAGSGRRYREARLEPGDTVTVVGGAVPFGHLEDPSGADHLDRLGDPLAGLEDPMVAADIAEARAAGELLTPEEAWGNAAIPGFGIGRPVRQPELDPAANAPTLATADDAARIERTFDLGPDLLVIAAGPSAPLLIAAGSPDELVGREEGRFLLGLLGAVLAIVSAIGAAVLLNPG
jgi:hypothetical protein